MTNCPKCGAMAVLFSDHEQNDLDALGLQCRAGCGWKLTMKHLVIRIRGLVELLRQESLWLMLGPKETKEVREASSLIGSEIR